MHYDLAKENILLERITTLAMLLEQNTSDNFWYTIFSDLHSIQDSLATILTHSAAALLWTQEYAGALDATLNSLHIIINQVQIAQNQPVTHSSDDISMCQHSLTKGCQGPSALNSSELETLKNNVLTLCNVLRGVVDEGVRALELGSATWDDNGSKNTQERLKKLSDAIDSTWRRRRLERAKSEPGKDEAILELKRADSISLRMDGFWSQRKEGTSRFDLAFRHAPFFTPQFMIGLSAEVNMLGPTP